MADTATLYFACLAASNWLRTQAKEQTHTYKDDIGDFLFIAGVELGPSILIPLNLFLVRLKEGYDSPVPDSDTRTHIHFARYTATSGQRSSGIAAIIISALCQVGLIALFRLKNYFSSRRFPAWFPSPVVTMAEFLYRSSAVTSVVLGLRLWAYYPFISEMLDFFLPESSGYGGFIVASMVCLCIWGVNSALLNPVTFRRHKYDRLGWRLWTLILFQLCCSVGYGWFMIGRWLDYKDYNPSSVVFTILVYFFAWMYLILWFNAETKERGPREEGEMGQAPPCSDGEAKVGENEESEVKNAGTEHVGESSALLTSRLVFWTHLQPHSSIHKRN